MTRRKKIAFGDSNQITVGAEKCPKCEILLSGVTAIGEYETEDEVQKHRNDSPTPGAVTICMGCGSLWLYDSQLKLTPVADETVRAGASKSIWLVVTQARELVKIRAEEDAMRAMGLKRPAEEEDESAWKRAVRRKRGMA